MELARMLAEPTPKGLRPLVRHVAVRHAVYAQLGFPGAEDLANMLQYYCELNYMFRSQQMSVQETP